MCTARIPMVTPVQVSSLGRSTTCSFERSDVPALQRNPDPGASGPSNVMDRTSGFQDGQSAIPASVCQTVSGSACTWISCSPTAGALRLISITCSTS